VSCRTIIIVPVYNECQNIKHLIPAIFSFWPDVHVLVVDDNSPDGTANVVQEMLTDERVRLMRRGGVRGYGVACVAGFQYALTNGYDYIGMMDADFSHDPKDVKALADLVVGGADLAIGSRYIPGASVQNWPLWRWLLSVGANTYVRFVLQTRVSDNTSGFRVYRCAALKALCCESIQVRGYAFLIEIVHRARKLGLKIAEHPIVFREREEGVSKMTFKIQIEAFFAVLRMKFPFLFGAVS